MILLTDICIISTKKGAFGITDLGAEGIDRFMANHKCNHFCNQQWLKPEPLSSSQAPNPRLVHLDQLSQVAESASFNNNSNSNSNQ